MQHYAHILQALMRQFQTREKIAGHKQPTLHVHSASHVQQEGRLRSMLAALFTSHINGSLPDWRDVRQDLHTTIVLQAHAAHSRVMSMYSAQFCDWPVQGQADSNCNKYRLSLELC